MSDLQKTNQTAIVSADRIKKLTLQYDETYPAKPAPQSLEAIADSRHKLPTLHQITQHRGAFTVALVTKCINEILKKVINVKRAMDADMIAGTSEFICQRFPQMTPADVKLFMTKGVMGEYGQIMDRVDGALILSWATQYWDQMKHLIRLRKKNDEKDDPRVPVPKEIEELSEKLRIKEIEKQKTAVIPGQRESLTDWYTSRGINIDERNKECEQIKSL